MALKFEKRLIILSGDNGAKGSLTLERNAFGFFASINVFNLPDLHNGEYAVGIKNKQHYFTRKLGSTGRIATRIQLDDTELNNIHCVIFDTLYERPLLYGSNDNAKLWQANMMDGFRTKKSVSIALGESEQKPFEYSERKDIDNYFLDILPKDEYLDNAVAAVNFYPSNMSIEVEYSKREQDMSQFKNPVDRAVEGISGQELIDRTYTQNEVEINSNENEVVTSVNSASRPYELFKRYINRYNKDALVEGNKENHEKEKVIKEITSQDSDGEIEVDINCKNNVGKNDSDDIDKVEEVNLQELKSMCKRAKAATPILNEKAKKRISPIERIRAVPPEKDACVNTVDNSVLHNEDEAAAIPSPSSYIPEKAMNKSMSYVFYEQVKPQLDELFKANPTFEFLENLMPDTKWVKVDYDNDGKYYVVGLIGSKPDYLCYGVPSVYSKEPPSELDGYCQWLPSDPENPEGDGFWLMFQDATSGDSVK